MSDMQGPIRNIENASLAARISVESVSQEQLANSTYTETTTSNDANSIKRGMQDIAPSPRNGVDAYLEIMENKVRSLEGGKIQIDAPIPLENSRYYGFYILNADQSRMERHMILSTFGDDPDFFITFGQEPNIWNFSGMLRNEAGQGSWHSTFANLYHTQWRASLLTRRDQFIRFRLGNMVMDGYILNFRVNQNSQIDDASVDFQMSMYVRKHEYVIINSTGQTSSVSELGGQTTYIVAPGDTLSEIAIKFGVSTETLRRLNGRTRAQDTTLQIGTVLVVKNSSTTPTSEIPPTRSHTVKALETLSGIAARYGSTVEAIVAANPYPSIRNREWDVNLIYKGEILIIP